MVSNELQVFRYTERHKIRTTVIDCEPWFVAKDIADVLGFSSATHAIRGLDDDEKGLQILETLGGNQNLTVISEPGLYKLIMRSSKPKAKQFTRWVVHEVLPPIHKRTESLVQVLQGKEVALLAERPLVEQTDSEGNRFRAVQPRNIRRFRSNNADNAKRNAVLDGHADSREVPAISHDKHTGRGGVAVLLRL